MAILIFHHSQNLQRHDIAEILLKLVLNQSINQSKVAKLKAYFHWYN
jgi:hypothetical protein